MDSAEETISTSSEKPTKKINRNPTEKFNSYTGLKNNQRETGKKVEGYPQGWGKSFPLQNTSKNLKYRIFFKFSEKFVGKSLSTGIKPKVASILHNALSRLKIEGVHFEKIEKSNLN